eukprot:CAMPEP_0197443286 /NCGR_PEP_ID=MMETSP1175-20131217/9052_1 /TAXON_ID=1003142 /ORGANISM="Triceratium dubium, Strain CCMP147" /LENGTH=301 /DNA_ID=CAMNT_0042973895 /DNA_START=197 /DNA_END=1102 /DNA_ORIENTATION=-
MKSSATASSLLSFAIVFVLPGFRDPNVASADKFSDMPRNLRMTRRPRGADQQLCDTVDKRQCLRRCFQEDGCDPDDPPTSHCHRECLGACECEQITTTTTEIPSTTANTVQNVQAINRGIGGDRNTPPIIKKMHVDESGIDIAGSNTNEATKPITCSGGLGEINNLVGLWEGTGGLARLSVHDEIERVETPLSVVVAITSVSDDRQFKATRCAAGTNVEAPMIGGVAPDLSRGKAKIYFQDSSGPVTYRFGTWEIDFFCADQGQVIIDQDLNTERGGSSGTNGTMMFKKIGEEVSCPTATY